MKLCQLVGMVGLLVILSGCQLKNETGHSQVLATVNGEEITFAEVDQYLHQHPELAGSSAGDAERVAIDAVIDQHLGQEAARQAGIDRLPSVMLDLLDARKSTLLKDYGRQLAASAHPPDLSALQAWYQAHPLWYADRRAYHVSRWVLQGDPYHQQLWLQGLARYSVLDDAASGWLARQQASFSRVPDVIEPESLPADRLARLAASRLWSAFVARQDDQFLEIWVLESVDPQPLDFAAARALVAQDMSRDAPMAALQQREAALRKTARIVYRAR